MAEERSEEEQIEALKAWWKRHGTSILVGIGLALALVLGWNAWENSQIENRMAAASRYQELLAALSTPDEGENRQDASVTYVADQLRTEYGDSAYAVLGSLLEADYLVESEQPAEAAQSLQWALEHSGEAPLPQVIRERLARAQFILGENQQALDTLAAVGEPGAFTAIYKELEGDILKAQGDLEAAREAYRAARAAASGPDTNVILEYKMADVAIPGDA